MRALAPTRSGQADQRDALEGWSFGPPLPLPQQESRHDERHREQRRRRRRADQNRLQRMGEAERAKLFVLMKKDENTRRVMTSALSATKDHLWVLIDIMEVALLKRRERRD